MAEQEKKSESVLLVQLEKPKDKGFKVSTNLALAAFVILSLIWLLPIVDWSPDYTRPLPVRATSQVMTRNTMSRPAPQVPTDCAAFSTEYSHACVMSDVKGKVMGADREFGNETYQFCWKHSDKYKLLFKSVGENVFEFRSQKGEFTLTYWLAKGETPAVCNNKAPPMAP